MSFDDQPTKPTSQPNGPSSSRTGMWEAPSVKQLQTMSPQYEVLSLLGRGGMGAVYKARQKSLRRLVAIKILPLASADDELNFAERFKNEAFAMARLSHTGIVNVHDAGETADGLLYFVMEYVEGRDLAHEIAERAPLPQAEVRSIAMQVCEALGYLHSNGVIHRDVKPANILLDAQGKAKVADFGLARLDEPLASGLLTRTGTSVGTADFMAPECRRAAATVDQRADLFSLGVAIYQMLTGELPHGMFKLPSQMLPEIDERFDDIICKALEPKLEDRYQRAREMRDDLEGIGVAVPHAETVDALPLKKPTRLWLEVSGLIAVLVLAALWFVTSERKPPVAELSWQRVDLSSIKGLKPEGGRYRCISYVMLEDLIKNPVRNIAVKVTAAPAPGDFPLHIMLRTVPGGRRYQGVMQTETIRGGIGYWEASRASPEELQGSTANRVPVDGQTSHELEFRSIEGNLTLLQDGIVVATATDARLKGGKIAIQIGEGGILSSIEYAILDGPSEGAQPGMTHEKPMAKTMPNAPWIDWLGPKLAAGEFQSGGYTRDGDGVTTDLFMKGVGVIAEGVGDAAVRVTGLLRGAGIQITARDRQTNPGRELYVAHDTGISLYIGRMMRDNTVVNLVEKKYPAGITRDGEHTLEFRCVGSTLTATLNGTFTITTQDSTLTQGPWAVVLKRGAVMKKVEVQVLTKE